MRTKQEVISFLESKVGTKVPCPGRPDLDGQCVTLIKSLMEFIGVPDPYKARGHAKTAISAYLSEGIADSGVGFLSVFSNKNMGGGYGHIWCNAGDGDGVFYESNGVKPLLVTKGKTYSYDAVCNFDKYIKGESMANMYKGYDLANPESMKVAVDVLVRLQSGELIEKAEHQKQLETLIKEKDVAVGDAYARGLGQFQQCEADYDELAVENAQLKKQLAEQPVKPAIDLSNWVENGLQVTTFTPTGSFTKNYKLKA